MKILFCSAFIFVALFVFSTSLGQNSHKLTINASLPDTLSLPKNEKGEPAAGKRVAITTDEYAGTNVRHMVYLPDDWNANWRKTKQRIPIIFEYTGNQFAATGSTGEVEDAALGYALSAGKYIWVTLPYISENGKTNQLKWWGNANATVEYAKNYVPQIIEEYGGDTNAVFLCGFSRGAIGVNYLGLYNDEVAKLWTGFITHDHFDGVKQWGGTSWGSPLEKYRHEAAKRLKRVGGRPFLVIQNGEVHETEKFVGSVLTQHDNFKFLTINTSEIFGYFPNKFAVHEHTDTWALLPSKYRNEVRDWLNLQNQKSADKRYFNELCKLDWQPVFYDSCTDDWKKKWLLDGKKARITHSEQGMDFWAGSNRKEDASHAVLWTKESFAGDIRIDYEYTKIEDAIEAVTILYIQATGSGADGYEKDISQWADKRAVAAMKAYFNHMNTFHISYAAFDVGNEKPGVDYIRARRYIPEKGGLGDTDLKPDYFNTKLFEQNVSHKITILKNGNDLFMYIQNEKKSLLCHWRTNKVPAITEGRIGLRHMWTRGARYKNFKISTLK